MNSDLFNGRIISFLLFMIFVFNSCGSIERKRNKTITLVEKEKVIPQPGEIKDIDNNMSDSNKIEGSGDNYSNINSEKISISGISFGQSIYEVENLLGTADSIVKAINEFTGDSLSIYYFNNSNFTIINNKVDGFEIKDESFVFEPGDIKIGDDEKNLQKMFIDSYNNKYRINNSSEVIKITINNSDEFLIFTVKGNKIISYYTWVNW